MPTVFDSLSEALKDNTVGADVAAQSAALAKVASTVAGLIEHPPKNIGDLGSVLQSLPLPNIDVLRVCSSLNSRMFWIAITAWSAKV